MTPTKNTVTEKPVDEQPVETSEPPALVWWLGVTEMLGQGMDQGTKRIERAHLAIAEESFRILREVPLIRPMSESVKRTHDLIARGTYASVGGFGRLLSTTSQRLRQPKGEDVGNHRETGSQPDAGTDPDPHHAR